LQFQFNRDGDLDDVDAMEAIDSALESAGWSG